MAALAWDASRPDRTTRPPGAVSRVSGAAKPLQRPQQDIGEDRDRRAPRSRSFASGDAVRFYHLDEAAGAVERGIGAGRAHRAAVDVGRQHGPPQGARGRDGEHARAGAEIEDAPSRQRLAKPIEREQAAARGAVMAGAEGQRRFDLDADAIDGNAGAVMGAVHDEAAGGDGSQSGEAFAHPILRRDALEAQRLGRCGSRGRGCQPRTMFSSGAARKYIATRQRPAPLSTRLTATSSAAKLSANKIRNAVRRLFIGFEPCNSARCGRKRAGNHCFVGIFQISPAIHKPARNLNTGVALAKLFTTSYTFIPRIMPNHSPGISTASRPVASHLQSSPEDQAR